ncbi:TRAP transporter small permease [Ornithinibacillus halophilus]|uniref:TRAP-type C4-dicarboxylate transport system, small permease component n=1 Tax=Ornithinibacillus halophilus TaxID=930117 RepID=A0A1M5LIS1_9BACI|nr:TRAP transporter small permease [Ornithinibacillus halophilus]SHG64263.1 TRAP-type C4-dicarboxylate transport system, small permease component [Ornithinibacillus halophilus]
MLKVLKKSELFLHKIIEFQQLLANLFLVFIMMIITIDVVGRNFFNSPLKGTYEMTELGSALLVFFALAITHQKDDHITIDFLMDRLSIKMRHILNGLIEIVIAIVLFFMARHIFENGLRMMERNSATTDLGLPVYPFLFLISVTLLLFMVTAFYKAMIQLRQVVDKT